MSAFSETAPITLDELPEHTQQVETFQRLKVRDQKRKVRVISGIAISSFALNMTLAVGLIAMLPLVRIVPIFVYIHKDGTTDTSESLKDMAETQREALVSATIWQYVRHREHYNAAEAKADFTIVTAMSSQTVAKQYTDYFNGDNPNSPQVKLGKDGFRNVDRISGGFDTHNSDYTSGVYRVRFCIRTVKGSNRPVEGRFAVVVGYTTSDKVTAWDQVRFNPGQLIVTSYPGPELEGNSCF